MSMLTHTCPRKPLIVKVAFCNHQADSPFCLWREVCSGDLQALEEKKRVCGKVDRMLDSRSEGLGSDSQCWPCVEVLGKLRIPHCLGPTSHNGYLVHRSKVGSIVAGCCAPTARGGKV